MTTHEIEKRTYNINGFQIRFFTEKKIRYLTTAEGFEILWITENMKNQAVVILALPISSKGVNLRMICPSTNDKTNLEVEKCGITMRNILFD